MKNRLKTNAVNESHEKIVYANLINGYFAIHAWHNRKMASSRSRIPVRMHQIVFVTVASYSHVAMIHSLYHNAKQETSYNFPTLMKPVSGEILTMSGQTSG